jgi:hypothetical protein
MEEGSEMDKSMVAEEWNESSGGGGDKGEKNELIFSLSSSTTPFTRDVQVRCISCRSEEPLDAGGGLTGATIGANSNCGKSTWSSADACTLTSPFLASGRTVVP